MYAILRDRNGHEIDRCKLSDTDPLDCDHFAAVFSNYLGKDLERETPESRIPEGGEDSTITQTDEHHAPRCWCSANYMTAQ